MKTTAKPKAQIKKTFKIYNRTFHLTEKDNNSVYVIDFKFYQKLILVLITLSTILIFPELPKELETVCESYYSRQICNVW